MNRHREPLVCIIERDFILETIQNRKRLDGREMYDYREINVMVSCVPGNVTVSIGDTRVQACVSCEVTSPRTNRPTDGIIFFNVTLSPMASPGFDLMARSSPIAIETTRILERCYKECRAIDTESLCIIAGLKVWSLRVDLHVLNYCGNISDAAAMAAIIGLKHFRRPDVTVVGETATIHPLSERDPISLSIHHIPLCITFAFYHNGQYMVIDPTLEEEMIMDGKLLIAMNIHQELCTLQLAGGVALLPEQVLRCVHIAKLKVSELNKRCFPQDDNNNTDRMIDSILNTNQSKNTLLSLEGCHGDNEQMNDDNNNVTEVKVMDKNTVQSYNIDEKKAGNKGQEMNIEEQEMNMEEQEVNMEKQEVNIEEEETMIISGTDIGGFKMSCDNEVGVSTKKRKKLKTKYKK